MQSPQGRVRYLSRHIVKSLRRQATRVGGIRLRRQLVLGKGLAGRVTSVQSEPIRRLGARFDVLGCSRPPTHFSTLQLPDDSALEAGAIRPDLEYPEDATGPFGLITLPRARVCMPSAMHLIDGWLLEESILTRGVIANPKYWWQARTARWRSAQRLPPGVLGPLTWHHNFYHWLIEILPRLKMVANAHCDPSLPIFMPQSSPSFVRESLKLVGLDHRVRWLPNGVYDAEGLIVPSRLSAAVYPTSEAIDWLRESMLRESIVGEGSKPRYLYVSRRDVADRVPSNEEEVASAMTSLGFEVINFSSMDLAAQIRFTSQARLLVGAHGAGFAHVAFLPEGAGVIELLEKGRGIVGGGYQYVASLVNARYGLLVHKRDGVDVPRLVRFVQQMLQGVESDQPGQLQKFGGAPRLSSTQS